jgi:hypothetical protein
MAFVPTIPGQDLGAGSDIALFLQKYAGEVLVAYDEHICIRPHVMARTDVKGVKFVQFPVIGKTTGTYHTRGEDILLDQDAAAADYLKAFLYSHKDVYTDDLFISPTFISELDELKNYWEVRGPIARKQGMALAVNTDTNLLAVVILGAQQANGLLGAGGAASHPGGNVITSATAGTNGGALIQAIQDMAIAFDQKDVPSEGRFIALKPAQYHLLVDQTDLVNTDFSGGPNGTYYKAVVKEVFGFTILKTNLLPTTNLTAVSTAGQRGTTYNPDASNTVAACWQKDAIGTVRLLDVQTELAYIPQRQGHLLMAKMCEGHDWLLPQACGQIQTA